MKLVLLSGALVGRRTRATVDYAHEVLAARYPQAEVTVVDLAAYDVQFSDGRLYWDYDFSSDTRYVATTVLSAQALIIASPIYQASIPAPLKNVFDLLPVHAFRDMVVSMLINAGSSRHYLVPEQQLKPILSYMHAHIVQNYVFMDDADFDDEAHIVSEDVRLRIQRLVEDTVSEAELFKAMRESRPDPSNG